MDDDWVRSLRDQCIAAHVAFFFKQRATASGKKIPLPELDGQQWMQFPTYEEVAAAPDYWETRIEQPWTAYWQSQPHLPSRLPRFLQDKFVNSDERMERDGQLWTEYQASDRAHTDMWGSYSTSWFQDT